MINMQFKILDYETEWTIETDENTLQNENDSYKRLKFRKLYIKMFLIAIILIIHLFNQI